MRPSFYISLNISMASFFARCVRLQPMDSPLQFCHQTDWPWMLAAESKKQPGGCLFNGLIQLINLQFESLHRSIHEYS